ncbi:MAG: TonB-dependent receptor [Bacteroidota bacterium]|nr:TonB-dependent receptor [Bacteroidota bacterium]
MKHIYIIVALFCAINGSTFAQEARNKAGFQIKGKLFDSSSSRPLEYATISLFLKNSKTPINGTVTDAKGDFIMDNVAAGVYKLVAEFIGYKSFTLPGLEVSKEHPITETSDIFLAPKTTTLQTINIAGQGNIIENKIDKMVFNAERDITSQTGVATDVLKKVPQVSVDVDGNVQLSGSSSVRFLINGKPSAMFGSNIADVLQSIPASQIKSIEVITNPGAKYDAQGVGGIINIILKKNNSQGVNGNLSLTGGTRYESGSFNFNARQGKFGINAYFSGNTRLKSKTSFSSDRLTLDTVYNNNILLQQDGFSQFVRGGFQTGINFDWDISDHNNLSGSFSYNNFSNTGNNITNQVQDTHNINGNVVSDIQTLVNADNNFHVHNLDASLNYKRTFKKEGQELDLSVNLSPGDIQSRNNNYQFALPGQILFYSTQGVNPGTENEAQIAADYTQPLKKDVMLGVGSKVNFYDISSDYTVRKLDSASLKYTEDDFLSNSLGYHQKVYALYAEVSFPFLKLFDAKIGERYERTEIEAFYSNAQQQPATPGYNTFVPSLFFSKKLTENSLLKLSYSKRIERPDYRDLNPYINTSDPKNLSTGNPGLKPEIGKRFELGYSNDIKNFGSVNVSLFYRINEQDIQPFIVFYPTYQVGDTIYTNVAVSKRENIGRENNIGVNFFGNINFIPKLDLRTNLFFFRRHTLNVIDKGYDYNSFNYRANLNASYQFSPTLAAEFFGNFSSARHEAQGTYPSFTTYSLAIRKQIWNKKGSLALTAANPFHKNIDQRSKLFGPNFTINSQRSIPFRSIGINFTWKFGKLEFKKPRERVNDSLNAPVDNG